MSQQICPQCQQQFSARLNLCPFCVAVEDALAPREPTYDQSFQAPVRSKFPAATPPSSQTMGTKTLKPSPEASDDVPAGNLALAWGGAALTVGLMLYVAGFLFRLAFPLRAITTPTVVTSQPTDQFVNQIRSFVELHSELDFGVIVEIKPISDWSGGKRYLASNFTETFVFYLTGDKVQTVWKEVDNRRTRMWDAATRN